VELGSLGIQEGLPVDDESSAVVLEHLVAVARAIDVHLVGEPRAAAADDLHAQTAVGHPLLGEQRMDLPRRLLGHADRRGHQPAFASGLGCPPSRFFFQSEIAALMPSSASTEQCILTGGSESSWTIWVFLICSTSSTVLPFTSSVT